jgi:hypothetical protein
VTADWRVLSSPTERPEAFDPAMVADLPLPARRWLVHAVAPGTPLWQSVELSMRGEIRIGSWRPFTARQVLAPPRGFVWAATARLSGLPVTGFDRFSSGSGEMRWRLGGLVPVMSASGPDVTRSAAGRLAGEATLLPTAFRAATWAPGSTGDRVVATWHVGGQDERVELHVDPGGRLLGAEMDRWGDPGGGPFARHRFGVAFEEERAFAGVTIGSVFRAGWWWGTDREAEGEFFRARITGATFR